MTYVQTVPLKDKRRGPLQQAVTKALGPGKATRLLVFRAGGAVVLVPEDSEARRIVERNERVLKARGVTVRDVLRVLREERRASYARTGA
ncbi:MAG: hypothetical protein AABZ30_14945 [Myxococcota bacterium]